MPEDKEDATVQVIAERISALHVDVTDLRNEMRDIVTGKQIGRAHV